MWKTVDKFEGYSAAKRSENGIYYVTEGTNFYISASLEQTIDLGTHTMFIAAVDDMEALTGEPSDSYADYICPICKHPASDFEKVTV